jgi:predicted N-acetyltransferase YhbS
MADGIRNLRPGEFDTFMRFLERCYGASPGNFERHAPHHYRPSAELCASAFVMEQEGQIVSHVGLYPLEVVVQGVTYPIGGIGGVGTLPAHRGKGYMTQLLYTVIEVMREREIPLSWLGGDRQRYNTFGWEQAGQTYELVFTRRSLERAGVSPLGDEGLEIEARYPSDALDVVERSQSTLACHTHRPHLALQMRSQGLRVWTTEDGYALVHGSLWGALSLAELVSASGRETSMVYALLDWTGRDEIKWKVSAWDGERLARLMPAVSHWQMNDWQMWRIVDLAQVLARARPLLQRRATAVRDFELAIGVREHDRTDVATIRVRDGEVEVARGRHADSTVEWSSVEAARVLLGGPPVGLEAGVPAGLAALLPIPVYLPSLDYV